MTFGIVDNNGYISAVENRFDSLEDAKGKVPEKYLLQLTPLPNNAVPGAYYIDGALSNQPEAKRQKKLHKEGTAL